MAKKKNNTIGFKVEPIKGKSGKGNTKAKTKTGKNPGFKGGSKTPQAKHTPVTKTGWSNRAKLTEPEDTKRFDKMGIVFFDNKVLNQITKQCLPTAKDSEFQIHYRALDIHIEKDGFEVVLSIPTAYYNFTQEVSSGSVDYELDDIDNEAEKVKAASEANVQDLLTKMPLFNAMNGAGYNVSFKEGNFGSIHRHPGRFGFSSIDLGKDPESPGVIYRQKVSTDFFQTDSVMYINGNECEIYTTEARIVNIKEAADGGVEGDYCQIPTISIVRPEDSEREAPDLASKVLGEVDTDIFSRFHFVGAFGAEIKKYPMLEVILEMLDSLEYNVDTSNIDEKRIAQKHSYARGAYGGKKYQGYGLGQASYYDEYYGMDIWDDYGEDWQTRSVGGTSKLIESEKGLYDTIKDETISSNEKYNIWLIDEIFNANGVPIGSDSKVILDALSEYFTEIQIDEVLELASTITNNAAIKSADLWEEW